MLVYLKKFVSMFFNPYLPHFFKWEYRLGGFLFELLLNKRILSEYVLFDPNSELDAC